MKLAQVGKMSKRHVQSSFWAYQTAFIWLAYNLHYTMRLQKVRILLHQRKLQSYVNILNTSENNGKERQLALKKD